MYGSELLGNDTSGPISNHDADITGGATANITKYEKAISTVN